MGFLQNVVGLKMGDSVARIYWKLSILWGFIGEVTHTMICICVFVHMHMSMCFCIIPRHNRRGFGRKAFMKL
jgi:hypothetical protein